MHTLVAAPPGLLGNSVVQAHIDWMQHAQAGCSHTQCGPCSSKGQVHESNHRWQLLNADCVA